MIPFITRRILSKLRWKKLYKFENARCFSLMNCKYSLHKKSLPHNLSFDDTRLQKHLEFLSDLFTKANRNGLDVNIGYSYEMLRHIQSLIHEIDITKSEIRDLNVLIDDVKDKEDELYRAALSEMENFQSKLDALQHEILEAVIPNEVTDDKNILLEITAGVGGQEAMLFAKDIFDMYCHHANWKGWEHEVLKYDTTDLGGIRAGHLGINGKNAFRVFKHESGVHRVQRVPKTERAGRIHTSTTTVAVLPQPDEIDIVIKPSDIELEFKKSSGAGGQHVNTTDSCVRIYHKPSGLVTESQVSRDQHRNRAIAMMSLRAKLYERELMAITNESTSARKLQIGSAARSEKVRTYNFAQDRITDHRAHVTLHGVQEFMKGEAYFDHMADMLQRWNDTQSLTNALNKYT